MWTQGALATTKSTPPPHLPEAQQQEEGEVRHRKPADEQRRPEADVPEHLGQGEGRAGAWEKASMAARAISRTLVLGSWAPITD